MTETLRAIWLGRHGFTPTLQLQQQARQALIEGTGPATLYLVEHPAVLTIGRRGNRADILWSDEQLAGAGVEVAETPRGGQVTLHAPGQLVAYPVVRVGRHIRQHLHNLADTTIDLLRDLGVPGARFRMEHPGVWVGEAKVASIGVHISRGVSVQGLSVNLEVDPLLFGALVSCGLQGVDVVSARDFGARPVSVDQAARLWAQHWCARTDCTLRWEEPTVADPVLS